MLSRIITRVIKRTATRSYAAATSPAVLPPLAHSYDAYEPVISSTIMEIHHSKHHATYVNNLNANLEAAEKVRHWSEATAKALCRIGIMQDRHCAG